MPSQSLRACVGSQEFHRTRRPVMRRVNDGKSQQIMARPHCTKIPTQVSDRVMINKMSLFVKSRRALKKKKEKKYRQKVEKFIRMAFTSHLQC